MQILIHRIRQFTVYDEQITYKSTEHSGNIQAVAETIVLTTSHLQLLLALPTRYWFLCLTFSYVKMIFNLHHLDTTVDPISFFESPFRTVVVDICNDTRQQSNRSLKYHNLSAYSNIRHLNKGHRKLQSQI